MMSEEQQLVIGLPKGSLQEATFGLFGKAGFKVRVSSRSCYPSVDDPELSPILIRAQEISRYVEDGVMDCGLTGYDWTEENGSDVEVVAKLVYAKQLRTPIRWVLAVPEDSPVRSVKDLEGKHVATELVEVTKRYLASCGVTAEVEFSWGATEAKAPRLADAIVELTETGSSLKANRLRVIDTVIESTTQVIVNKESWKDPWKKEKIENLVVLLQGAIAAADKVGLKMNVEKSKLDEILKALPALKNPTVSPLSDKGWFAIETIIDENVVRKIVPDLKRKGAEGIIEYPLNKVIP